eukprot:3512959-Alexandrium_andersonii.AAC.1
MLRWVRDEEAVRDEQGVRHVQVLPVALVLLLPQQTAPVRQAAQHDPVRQGAVLDNELGPPQVVLFVAWGPLP